MNETKEESKSSRKDMIKRYEEIVDDGKKYYPVYELQEMNLALQCSKKNGVIITGPSGSGKTALVHCFAQQDLQEVFDIKSIRIVRIKPIWMIQKMDMDKILQVISSAIEEYESPALIFSAEFDSLDLLRNAIEVVNFYINDIKEHYNMKFLKFIFEFTKTSKTDLLPISNSKRATWEIISSVQKNDIDLFMDRILPRVDELSSLYQIDYTRDTIMFYVTLQAGWSDFDNLNPFIDVVEKAFIISKKNGKKSLDRDTAKLLFFRTFERLENMPKEALINTARHEAGHALLRLISNKPWSLSFVTIIPGNGFNGATVSDKPKNVASYYKDKDYFLLEIAVKLAGREAENMLDKNVKPNAGACGDLENAMILINDIVNKYGFFDDLGKNYVFPEKGSISEKCIENIEQEKRKLLKSATDLARNILFEHCDFLEKLADRLCEELVLFNYQVYDMWNKYLDQKE